MSFFKKIFQRVVIRLSKKPYKVETIEFGKHQLKVVRKTWSDTEDYDHVWFYLICQNKKRVLDVGSNVGYTALLAGLNDNVERVALVDPNQEAMGIAFQNLLLNNLIHKCNFINSFTSTEKGEKVKFFTVGAGAAGSMFQSHAKTASSLNQFYWVDTSTIDDIVEQVLWEPDFIKIDVEGAESLALAGAKKTAAKKQAIFMVEMHASEEQSMLDNAEKVLSWCAELGYDAWYMAESNLLPNAQKIAHRGKCHLLLQPKGVPYPAEILSVKQGTKFEQLPHHKR